jgi:hypothetical protein
MNLKNSDIEHVIIRDDFVDLTLTKEEVARSFETMGLRVERNERTVTIRGMKQLENFKGTYLFRAGRTIIRISGEERIFISW